MPAGNKKVINTFNACHQVPFQKHPINRFVEKFWSVDFGPKYGLFFPFWAKQEFSWKKGFGTF